MYIPGVWAFEFHPPVSKNSNIGWLQQPPTEKVLKFNMRFLDSVKIYKICTTNITLGLPISFCAD